MSKIIVVGDFNADLVLFMDRFPVPGETLNGNRFFQGPGGKGSNQAAAAARLGAEVTFFGCVGTDNFGQIALGMWQENGINTEHVIRSDETNTGVAMIYVDEQGDNMIVVNQAANLLLTPAHVEAIEDVVAEADVLMCTLGVPLDVAQRGMELARKHNTRTIMNTAPAAPLSQEMLNAADYLTPNETELAAIADLTVNDGRVQTARSLLQRDDQAFVITLGAQGAQYVSRTEEVQVPTFDVEVVDTVGAGDAFNAALGVAVAEGQSTQDALRFACAAAALSVTKVGAVDGMPTRAEVDTMLTG